MGRADDSSPGGEDMEQPHTPAHRGADPGHRGTKDFCEVHFLHVSSTLRSEPAIAEGGICGCLDGEDLSPVGWLSRSAPSFPFRPLWGPHNIKQGMKPPHSQPTTSSVPFCVPLCSSSCYRAALLGTSHQSQELSGTGTWGLWNIREWLDPQPLARAALS